MKYRLLAVLCYCLHITSFATVILQYHHVSESTPASTSTTPEQFAKHMRYLADNNFTVVALSTLMDAIKQQQILPDKTVVITFDDAYLDILQNGKPILGLDTDLTSIPRFPVSQPYDQLSSLRDKVDSLAFSIRLDGENQQTLFQAGELTSVSFNIKVDDFKPEQLNCYISGLGRQKIQWQDHKVFSINFSAPLPTGRVRCNCTAPSISKPGRFYWYSKPWLILQENRQWFPL